MLREESTRGIALPLREPGFTELEILNCTSVAHQLLLAEVFTACADI